MDPKHQKQAQDPSRTGAQEGTQAHDAEVQREEGHPEGNGPWSTQEQAVEKQKHNHICDYVTYGSKSLSVTALTYTM